MLQRVGLADHRLFLEGCLPVETLIMMQDDDDIDAVVHLVSPFKQAIEIFDIGGGDVANDLESVGVVPICLDAPHMRRFVNGGHGVLQSRCGQQITSVHHHNANWSCAFRAGQGKQIR